MWTRKILVHTLNQAFINDFLGLVPDIVHPANPLHLIFCFKLFCDTLLLCQLLNQLGKHSFCLGVNLSKMVIQLAAEK